MVFNTSYLFQHTYHTLLFWKFFMRKIPCILFHRVGIISGVDTWANWSTKRAMCTPAKVRQKNLPKTAQGTRNAVSPHSAEVNNNPLIGTKLHTHNQQKIHITYSLKQRYTYHCGGVRAAVWVVTCRQTGTRGVEHNASGRGVECKHLRQHLVMQLQPIMWQSRMREFCGTVWSILYSPD